MKFKEWIILILLCLSVIVSVIPKREYFIDSVQLYQQSVSNATNKQVMETNYLKKLHGLKSDLNTDLLFMDRCLKFKKSDVDTMIQKVNFPYHKIQSTIMNQMDLEKQIMVGIEDFYLKYKLSQLRGPIYVMVFQAPYLRVVDENCSVRPIHIQYNIKDYQYLGYLVGKDTSDLALINNPNGCSQNINTEKTSIIMYLLFPSYDKKLRPLYVSWENIKCNMMPFFNQREFDDKCFIRCKDSSKYVCGCLNSTIPYESKCIENNGNYNDYGIMYLINGEEASRRVRGVFGISFFADTTPIQPTGIISENYCKDLSNRAPLPSI